MNNDIPQPPNDGCNGMTLAEWLRAAKTQARSEAGVPRCPECGQADEVIVHDPDCPKWDVHFDWSCARCGFGFDPDDDDEFQRAHEVALRLAGRPSAAPNIVVQQVSTVDLRLTETGVCRRTVRRYDQTTGEWTEEFDVVTDGDMFDMLGFGQGLRDLIRGTD